MPAQSAHCEGDPGIDSAESSSFCPDRGTQGQGPRGVQDSGMSSRQGGRHAAAFICGPALAAPEPDDPVDEETVEEDEQEEIRVYVT